MEAKAHSLSENDEGDAAQHGALKATLPARASLGDNQTKALIVTQGGCLYAAASYHLLHGQYRFHAQNPTSGQA